MGSAGANHETASSLAGTLVCSSRRHEEMSARVQSDRAVRRPEEMSRQRNESGHEEFPFSYRVTPQDIQEQTTFIDKITDVPASLPKHRIPLNRVGITGLQATVNVQSLLDCESVVHLPCTLDMYVNLPGSQRGIHMSRIHEVLISAESATYRTVGDFTRALAENLGSSQEMNQAFVFLHGKVAKQCSAPATGKNSSYALELIDETSWAKNSGCRQRIGIQAYNMTSCPCTLAYSRFSTLLELLERYDLEEAHAILDSIITFSHSQRGHVRLLVDKTNDDLQYEHLFRVLKNSTHLVYTMLKRQDEHELASQAHLEPQFTEDVVRGVFAELQHTCAALLSPDSFVRIESHVFESIHSTDVHSVLEGEFSNLANSMARGD